MKRAWLALLLAACAPAAAPRGLAPLRLLAPAIRPMRGAEGDCPWKRAPRRVPTFVPAPSALHPEVVGLWSELYAGREVDYLFYDGCCVALAEHSIRHDIYAGHGLATQTPARRMRALWAGPELLAHTLSGLQVVAQLVQPAPGATDRPKLRSPSIRRTRVSFRRVAPGTRLSPLGRCLIGMREIVPVPEGAATACGACPP